MREDYDSQGKLKPNAIPLYEPLPDLNALNKRITIDSGEDWANFKTWINLMKFEIQKK